MEHKFKLGYFFGGTFSMFVIKVKFETVGTFCTYVFSTTPEFFDSLFQDVRKIVLK